MNTPQTNSIAKIFLLLVGMFAQLTLLLAYLFPFHLLPWTTFYNEWLFAVFVGLGLAWTVAHGQLRLSQLAPWAVVLLLLGLHVWVVTGLQPAQLTLGVVVLMFGLVGWLPTTSGLNLARHMVV